ncbi:hypothetical protein Pmani_031501 [Petrolisthes manimaculis]|uniref:Uncharacterized protein n=1 Tax=Petrolisthes manimaculis TaxID=1843537 RepID=A0AAE1TUS6_9EUCA|nr:hypothetical protein Pmani_031501 [Petrolisthes manimaculis]
MQKLEKREVRGVGRCREERLAGAGKIGGKEGWQVEGKEEVGWQVEGREEVGWQVGGARGGCVGGREDVVGLAGGWSKGWVWRCMGGCVE